MNIFVENSTWNNIGDSFYQIGIQGLLSEILPDANILAGEGPPRRAFGLKQATLEKCFHLREHQEADLYIFSGPIVSNLHNDYAALFQSLKREGKRYALMSVSTGRTLEQNEINRIGKILKDSPPDFITTRDQATYDVLAKIFPNTYNGICTAFVSPKYVDVAPVKESVQYFTSSFHRIPEPDYSFPADAKPTVDNIQVTKRKPFPFKPLAETVEFRSVRPADVGPFSVVRPQHGIGRRLRWQQFPHANSFASYNPSGYYSIYRSTKFTVTDRVHAAAITVALGNPAILLWEGYRSGIFPRLGMDFSGGQVMRLDRSRLEEETENLKTFLLKNIS